MSLREMHGGDQRLALQRCSSWFAAMIRKPTGPRTRMHSMEHHVDAPAQDIQYWLQSFLPQ